MTSRGEEIFKEELINLFKKKEYTLFETNALNYIKKYKDTEVMNLLSEVYIEKKKFNTAKALLLEVLEMNKSDINSLLNLGRLYYIANKTDDSKKLYFEVLRIDPISSNALLGVVLNYITLKEFEDAIYYLQRKIESDKVNCENYHLLGDIYLIIENYDEASKFYGLSTLDKSKARELECLYVLGEYDKFLIKLNFFIKHNKYFPLVASLSSHFSYKNSLVDNYNFCNKPMDFIYKKNLLKEEICDDNFIKNILYDFNNTVISKRQQNLLNGGFQSGGNIFDLESKSIRNLEKIIDREINSYRQKFSNSTNKIITKFPKKYTLSGWIIRIKKGDYLKPHIHEEGWLSGSFYLNMPRLKKLNQGSIEFSLEGGRLTNEKKIFPTKLVDIEKGDFILFPSSLFHSTVPIESNEERITLAFDVRPK